MDPIQKEELQRLLRSQGIDDATIETIIGTDTAESAHALGKMYDQSAYLRKAATAGDTSKNVFGAAAQGLAGYMTGQKDNEYKDIMKQRQQADMLRNKAVYGLERRRRRNELGLPDTVNSYQEPESQGFQPTMPIDNSYMDWQ